MGDTITEKILGEKTGGKVSTDEIITVPVDLLLANDITAPIAIERFEEIGASDVFDKRKVVLTLDHFVPAKDIKSATNCKMIRDFAKKYGIKHLYDLGTGGIEHVLLPEEGLVLPGDIVIGADSHTCTYGALGAFASGVGSSEAAAVMATGKIWLRVPATIRLVYKGTLKKWICGKDLILHTIGDIGISGALYKVMEFTGETIRNLSMDSRFTMCNMAVEAGAKTGIVEPDKKTIRYVEETAKRPYKVFKNDKDANYVEERIYEVDCMEPMVATPHLPSNVKPVSEVEGTPIDQAVIGSCTNGRIEDLRAASKVLVGNRVHPEVRLYIFPATQKITLQALKEGLLEVFLKAGAVVNSSSCGPCLGGHLGVLAKGEKAISSTNRNFMGRMGHPKSEIYLASPATVAASAVKGVIAHPKEVA